LVRFFFLSASDCDICKHSGLLTMATSRQGILTKGEE
jgi:hypothetical protein